MKKLIINADDFGYSANRNRGIRECVENGIVTSVSIIANFPAAGEAVEYVKGRDIGVAVHLNLSQGPPLAKGLTFLDDGNLPGKDAVQQLALYARLDPEEVERELEAQVRRVTDAGVALTHLDGHHHIHAFPGVAEVS